MSQKYDRGKEIPREVRMFTWNGFVGFLMLILTVIVVSIVVIVLCYVRDFLLDELPKLNRRRLLRKNAAKVLAGAIGGYSAYLEGKAKYEIKAGYTSEDLELHEKFQFEYSELRRKLRLESGQYLRQSCLNFVNNALMPSLKCCSSFTDFLDQLLKMRADQLQLAYNTENELRKKYNEKDVPDTYSRNEMKNIMEKEIEIRKKIAEAEKNFWLLHDTLSILGHDTWGHKSYKTYVCLKPLLPSVTLHQFV
jgi:hypothetical protein